MGGTKKVMEKIATIKLENPYNYDKVWWGNLPVEISWNTVVQFVSKNKHIKLPSIPKEAEEHIEIRAKNGELVPFQIDEFDKKDETKSTLVFPASIPHRERTEYYLYYGEEKAQRSEKENTITHISTTNNEDFEIENDVFTLCFNLRKDALGRSGYSAGSASYVKIKKTGTEVTNPHDIWDPWKRLMQLDRVRIPSVEIDCMDRNYVCVSFRSKGPVRSFLTVRLAYRNFYIDRILTIYPEKEYIIEDIFVTTSDYQRLAFRAVFFMKVPLGLTEKLMHFWDQEWGGYLFAGSDWERCAGVGFASIPRIEYFTSHHEALRTNPIMSHYEWGIGETNLEPGKKARCLHKFMDYSNTYKGWTEYWPVLVRRQERQFRKIMHDTFNDALRNPIKNELSS